MHPRGLEVPPAKLPCAPPDRSYREKSRSGNLALPQPALPDAPMRRDFAGQTV
jgi:hypothetical protein